MNLSRETPLNSLQLMDSGPSCTCCVKLNSRVKDVYQPTKLKSLIAYYFANNSCIITVTFVCACGGVGCGVWGVAAWRRVRVGRVGCVCLFCFVLIFILFVCLFVCGVGCLWGCLFVIVSSL